MPQQGQAAWVQPCMRPLQQPSSDASTAQVGAGGHHSNVLEGPLQEGAALAHGLGGGDCSGGSGSGAGGGGSEVAVAAVYGLSCERPDGKLLFQDVSFQVHPGQHCAHWPSPACLPLPSQEVHSHDRASAALTCLLQPY